MFQITFTAETSELDLIEEKLFALGASSVSISSLANNKNAVTALAETPEKITDHFSDRKPEVHKIHEADWKDRWMEYYRGAVIDEEIFAGPDPDFPEAHDAKYFIHLDPRDAFGDGRHPTTILCMRELRTAAEAVEGAQRSALRLLDAGTGSGIIAILAEMLGIGTIDGVELDPEACDRAEENLRRNNCSRITLHQGDIASFSSERKYHLIVANLLTDIILSSLGHLTKLMAPGGSLIISGIGRQWDPQVKDALESHNLLVKSFTELEGWCCYRVEICP